MSSAATIDNDAPRAAVLRSADLAFSARGVAGVGMADIRDDAGVSLRRLYGLYPSKRELVSAWLTARHTTWMEWFEEAIERLGATGEEPLLAAFDALAEWASSPGYRSLPAIPQSTDRNGQDPLGEAIDARARVQHDAGDESLAYALAQPGQVAGILDRRSGGGFDLDPTPCRSHRPGCGSADRHLRHPSSRGGCPPTAGCHCRRVGHGRR